MQLTINGCLINTVDEDKLNNLCRKYQSAKRYAFNRLLESQDFNGLKKDIAPKFDLNMRYTYAAMLDAEAVISSQRKLIKEEIADTKAKIKKSKSKLKKVKDPLKRSGLFARIDKLNNKLTKYQHYKKTKAIPKIVFGGRKNFIDLQKGKITKEDWKQLRNNAFYSIGGTIDGGNQNLRIMHVKDNIFDLRINIGARKWVHQKLWMPDKYVGVLKSMIANNPYSVRVIRKDKWELHISCDYLKEPEIDISNGVAGFDVNPDNLSVTITTPNGNFRASKMFKCHELSYARTNRREWLLGNLVKDTFEWIKLFDVKTIGIENLKFKKAFDTNHKSNRKRSNFTYAKSTELIISRALKEKMAIIQVNPKFTSLIGEYKYATTYGISIHQAAALVVARRAMGYSERVPKILLRFITFVKKGDPLVKPMEGFRKWGILYGTMKRVANSKLQNVLCAFGLSIGLDDIETVNSVLHGAIPCPTHR